MPNNYIPNRSFTVAKRKQLPPKKQKARIKGPSDKREIYKLTTPKSRNEYTAENSKTEGGKRKSKKGKKSKKTRKSKKARKSKKSKKSRKSRKR